MTHDVFEDEAGILEGRLTPGQGTDYLGELGPEDQWLGTGRRRSHGPRGRSEGSR